MGMSNEELCEELLCRLRIEHDITAARADLTNATPKFSDANQEIASIVGLAHRVVERGMQREEMNAYAVCKRLVLWSQKP